MAEWIILIIAIVGGLALIVRVINKPITMKIVYPDGSFIVGERGRKEIGTIPHESKGTHHFTVVGGSEEFNKLIGEEIAVPIDCVKYFVINPQKELKKEN